MSPLVTVRCHVRSVGKLGNILDDLSGFLTFDLSLGRTQIGSNVLNPTPRIGPYLWLTPQGLLIFGHLTEKQAEEIREVLDANRLPDNHIEVTEHLDPDLVMDCA